MIGIYKITNPKGKVYIGQSINIVRRMKSYSKMYCKQQPKIYNSLKKYGWENHEFDVLVECKIKELNFLETLYKKFYLNKLKGWEFIKRWDSISEACLFLGKSLTDGNIGLVCKGVRKTAHGFIWRYCKATF